MTARNIIRNPPAGIDSDFKTFEATTIKETEEELAVNDYLNYAQYKSNSIKSKLKKDPTLFTKLDNNLNLKTTKKSKPVRFSEEVRRSKSAIKLNLSKKDYIFS